jgi:HemK-related putative methylase
MINFKAEFSKKDLNQIIKDLKSFYLEHSLLFKSLFNKDLAIEYKGEFLHSLNEIGLVTAENNIWKSYYSVYEFQNQFFITDRFSLAQTNRVFPLSNDESMFLSSKININENDSVLDIGTGSGIYAIIAAKTAKSVTAIDINERALQYANFNARINGVWNKIEFINTNLFTNVNCKNYNLIISNPAIIPAPRQSKFYIHSDGGLTGTEMSYKILNEFENYLSENGRLQMLATSFSLQNKKLIIEKYITENFSKTSYKFTIQELYNPPLEPLINLTDKYKGLRTHEDFVKLFKEQNFISLHYLFITVERNSKFTIVRTHKVEKFDQTGYNGNWEGRLARLFLVYSKINDNKKEIEREVELNLHD